MKQNLIPYLIGMATCGIPLMTMSIKFKWSEKLWNVLNKRINKNYNVVIWLLIAAFMPAVIELLAETIAGRNIIISKTILGAIVGIQSSFMPGLGVSSKTKKE
ncbi:hypothetical protein [Clostridium oceanicum]|uniref:Holin n=1 Tax=Clostridium oceanicum TaxID=1543 RepID=A0ABP3UMG3_9CLOT